MVKAVLGAGVGHSTGSRQHRRPDCCQNQPPLLQVVGPAHSGLAG